MKVAFVVLLFAVGTLVWLTAILVGRIRFPLRLLLVVGAAAIAFMPISAYLRFHPSHAFISRSPANEWWAVDCFSWEGFRDAGYDFRVHDLRANLWGPIHVGDLLREGYEPGSLYWSGDGTVAAATLVTEKDRREIFFLAYDFKVHRIIRHANEEAQNGEIERLLSSRGGSTKKRIPSYKEL